MATTTPDNQPASKSMFSVLVPAYNAGHTLSRTLDSLLAQTCDDWECIVVDDGSTDDTLVIAEKYSKKDVRFIVISQDNAGTGAALDRAASVAQGIFLVQLGADDELLPEHCAKTAKFIESNPRYDIFAANAWQEMPTGSKRLFNQGANFEDVTNVILEDLIRKPSIYGTAAVRRSVYESVGGFSSLSMHEDYDFWLKALLLGSKHIYQPEVLSVYHDSDTQKTSDPLKNRIADYELLSSLIGDKRLTAREYQALDSRLAELQKNIAIRQRLYAILGRKFTEKIIAFARGNDGS